MKPSIKKLTLRKEALRVLAVRQLEHVGGGASPNEAIAFDSGKMCPAPAAVPPIR